MCTIRSCVQLGDSPPPLGVFLAVGGHSFERIKCRCRRDRGFSYTNIVAKDSVKGAFVDVRTESAEAGYLVLLVIAKRFGGRRGVFIFKVSLCSEFLRMIGLTLTVAPLIALQKLGDGKCTGEQLMINSRGKGAPVQAYYHQGLGPR